MRKIVFIGNCQADVVRAAYDRFVNVDGSAKTHYVATFREPTPGQRALVSEADIVVEMVLDAETPSGLEKLAIAGKKYRFPLVAGGWLWPNHGMPHPHAATFRYHKGALTNCSDAFLNKMVMLGVAPAAGAQRYAAQTEKDFRGLDRRFELMLEKQRARDEVTGFATADLIERYFREEQTFTTIFHPTARLAKYLVMELFGRMGVPDEALQRTQHFLHASFYPKTEVPIHPVVAEHFKLAYVQPGHRYPWLSTGFLDFEAYATRYIAWDVNDTLEDGLDRVNANRFEEALEPLLEGLAASPDSIPGLVGLMRTYTRLGRAEDAIAAGDAAPDYATNDALFQAVLGIASAACSLHEKALQHFHRSLALEPSFFQTYMDASFSLWRTDQPFEALAMLEQALTLAPGNPAAEARVKRFRQESGRFERATVKVGQG